MIRILGRELHFVVDGYGRPVIVNPRWPKLRAFFREKYPGSSALTVINVDHSSGTITMGRK